MIQTKPFTIPPARLAYLYAEEYLRSFWWMFIGIPVSGLVVLLLVPGAIAKYIGMVCLLWPLTIPARAFLLSRKISKVLSKPTTAEFREDGIYFEGQDIRSRALWSTIRNAEVRKEYLILRTRRLSILLVPMEAIPEDQRDKALGLVAEHAHVAKQRVSLAVDDV
jgi:hypothetical protein